MKPIIIEYASRLYPEKLRNIEKPPSRLYVLGNIEILNEVGADTYCICNELGGIINSGRTDWFSCDVDDIAVYVDIEVNDDEINALIEQLPKFKKRC